MIIVGMGGVILKFVYPATIGPAFDYSARLKAEQKKLGEIETKKSQLRDRLKERYYEYVSRTGGTDLQIVEDDLLNSVNELIISSRLQSRLLSPKSAAHDRRTGIYTVTVSFDAQGKFADCIGFIRKFYETPYLARFESLKITPTGNRGNRIHDECRINGEIAALVMPAESPFKLSPGDPPDVLPRYAHPSEHYNRLASMTPFIEYVAPEPSPPPTPAPQVVKATPTPRPPSGPPSSRDAAQTVLRMIMRYGVDEVRTQNIRTKESEYVSIGETLDGGELVMVHSLGAVVHKADNNEDYGYFFYPLGETLDANMPLADARHWPEIQVAMLHYQRDLDALAGPYEEDYEEHEATEPTEPRDPAPTGDSDVGGGEPSAALEMVGPPAAEAVVDDRPSVLIDDAPVETPAPRGRPRPRLPTGSRPQPAPATQAADTQESEPADDSAQVESNNMNLPRPASPRIVQPVNRAGVRPTPSPRGPR